MTTLTGQTKTDIDTDAGSVRRTRPAHRARRRHDWFYPVAGIASLALAGLSLLVAPNGLGYDPWSWLVWGRELAHNQFTTAGAASSWKPLPVVFTALFAFTRSKEPDVWLVIARAGAVMAILIAGRVGHRLKGPVAGGVALIGLLTSFQYLSYLAADGMSEPCGAALCLAALDAHLSKRRWAVLFLLLGASLVRVELSVFLAAYGLWWVVRGASRRAPAFVGVAALLVVIALAWVLPDYLTTGDALRSASMATHPSQGGPLLDRYPGLAVFSNAASLLMLPLSILFAGELAVGVVAAFRRRRIRREFGLAVAALALVVVEAAMAQAQVATGAPRYVLPAVGVASVVVGGTLVDFVRFAAARIQGDQRRRVAVAALYSLTVAVCVVPVVQWEGVVGHGITNNQYLATLADRMPEAIEDAGGRQHVLGCGQVGTVKLQIAQMTWALGLKFGEITAHPQKVGTVFSVNSEEPPIPSEYSHLYHLVASTALTGVRWRVATTCALPPATATADAAATRAATSAGAGQR